MKNMRFSLVLVCLVGVTFSESTYQNSSHICNQCICTSEGTNFILNCTAQEFQHVLADWPPHNITLNAIFSHNNITTLEELPISNQTARVVFDHCNIKYINAGAFKNVKNVEMIDLSYNLLSSEEIDNEDFEGPYNNTAFRPLSIKHLNLAYNQIHSLPRKLFSYMTSLEELNLEGNDFNVLDVNTQMALGTLTNLKKLNLANNELAELVEDAVKNLQSLEELDLSSNHLHTVPNTLDFLKKSLKVLRLSDNYIFKLDDKSFLGLDLVELHLNNLPRITAVGPSTFAPLNNLKTLHLCNNTNLRIIDREAFSQSQSLLELYLNNNAITELSHGLLNWTFLKVFEVYDNPLECECNMYNITTNLNEEIKRNPAGPTCIDLISGKIRQIFSLSETTCNSEVGIFHISHPNRHFHSVRTILIVLSTVLLMGTTVVIFVSILKYRKGLAFRNYAFAAQVSYNPVNTWQ